MVPAHRPTALALALCLGAWSTGCPRGRGVEEALRAALATADVAWRDRGTDGFEPVEDALATAEALAPGHPEVGWRRVRLGIARGLEADDPVLALRAFAGARDVGMSCARGQDGSPASADVSRVLRSVGDAQAPCVVWTTLAWARWLEVFGPEAAALDLPRVDALIEWSAARPSLGGPHAGVAAWAEGIVAAVRTEAQGRDLGRARDLLGGVATDQADDAVALLDLLRLVALPSGDAELAHDVSTSLREADLDTPEERGAVGRWRITESGSPRGDP